MISVRQTTALLAMVSFWSASGRIHATAAAQAPADEERDREMIGYIDEFFATHMPEWDLPGACCAIVRNDQVILVRGYGVASLESSLPVDPQRTRFYLASVAKLFTAVAVLQQAERGRVDLYADINHYLTDMQVPRTFEQPITLACLLTHTGGFEDRSIGLLPRDGAARPTLGTYLSEHLPSRVRPPGVVTMYDNHGWALAGHVLEQAVGTPFETIVQQGILGPLGMQHSGYQPMADDTIDQARGYTARWGDDGRASLTHAPLIPRVTTPAGGISATPQDIATLMLALLRDRATDKSDAPSLLSDQSIHMMRSQQFSNHPNVPGLTFGFWEEDRNNRRVLSILGSAPGAAARITLLPEEQIGLFVACTRAEPAFTELVQRTFIDQFFPNEAIAQSQPTSPAGDSRAAERAALIDGVYRSNRLGRSTIERVTMWESQVRVLLCVTARSKPCAAIRLLIGARSNRCSSNRSMANT